MKRLFKKVIARLNKPRPIGHTLTVNVLAIILLLSGSIMISTILGTQTIVKSLSRVVMNQTFVQSENALEHFLKPIEFELHLAYDRVRTGLIDPEDPDQFIRLLIPFLEQSKMVNSVLFSNGRDQNWLLDKSNEECRVKPISPDLARPFFDAVTRSGRDSEKNVIWIPRHHQLNPHEATSSAVISIPSTKDNTGILAFNIQVSAIARFIQEIRPLEKGHTVIALPDGFLLGLPWFFLLDQDPLTDEKLPALPVLSEWSLGKKIADQLDSRPGLPSKEFKTQLLKKKINDTTWWTAGTIVQDNTENQYHIFILLPEDALIGALLEQRKWFIAFTVLALIIGIYQVRRFARHYSRPIRSLVMQSNRISQGDLEPPDPIDTHVLEVQLLAQAHSQMRTGLKSLMKIERDLQLAKQIQQSSLPKELPQLTGFDIAAWNAPADETGGDTFDVIGLKQDQSCAVTLTTGPVDKAILLLADATGHGMGPALSVTQLRAMLRMGCHIAPELTHWAEHINEQLYDDLPNGRFITAWLGEISSEEHTLTYFSAGQGPLLYFQNQENKIIELPADTYPMGVMKEMEIKVNKITMNPGDIFTVVSDGIFEAANSKKERMGIDRVSDVIQKFKDWSAQSILEQIQAATQTFTQDHPADDDQTILIIKRN